MGDITYYDNRISMRFALSVARVSESGTPQRPPDSESRATEIPDSASRVLDNLHFHRLESLHHNRIMIAEIVQNPRHRLGRFAFAVNDKRLADS